MQRLLVALASLLVTVLAATLLGTTTPASGASSATPVPTGTIAWHRCSDSELSYLGFQCATLRVPLDHAWPGGPTIDLALSRRRHTSSAADYKGVMLTNPGGPGGSGLSTPSLADYVPGGVAEDYDWIGFDPRGVGASRPALRCQPGYFGYDRPAYVPTRAWIQRAWRKRAARYADLCADTVGERALLRHVTTLDTVRDMEWIRRATGATLLNYYGFSYGTYLGQVYATRYPGRVGRFVLDGVVDPRRAWYGANLDQDRAFDRNINAFFQYVASYPGAYRLGRDWRDIRARYYRLLTRLDRRPTAGGRIGPAELTDVLTEAGYYVYDWVGLADALSELMRTGRGGDILQRYRSSNAGGENGYAIYSAVECTDAPWPGWDKTRRDAWYVHRRAPFLTWGNTWYNAPCLTWRARPRPKAPVSGRQVTAPVLLVSETRDAATPYSGALRVRGIFPSSALVAGLRGTTHSASMSGVACVDNTIARYLDTGLLPARRAGTTADRFCPRVPPPSPWTSSLRGGMSDLTRENLRQAQRGYAR